LARPTDQLLLLKHAVGRAQADGVWCEVEATTSLEADLDPDRIGQAIDHLVDNVRRLRGQERRS
jgi:hypothetical protein